MMYLLSCKVALVPVYITAGVVVVSSYSSSLSFAASSDFDWDANNNVNGDSDIGANMMIHLQYLHYL